MSIKKLFEDSNKTNTFVADTNQKDAFESVESERNVEQKLRAKERYVPQIDYSEPANFVKYGSARLYYESAFNRILDFYPYDGSEAEITKFHNNNLDIEEYILEKKYPKSTGYITLARDGFTISSKSSDGYGAPTTNEYIDLKGGPGTGSATSLELKKLLPNPYNDNHKSSNVYSNNIYTDAGLPSDYGKGSRQSNLRANFDDGVTIEFWMKSGSMFGVNSDKQVIFDSWNNNSELSADYGRIILELTGTVNAADTPKNPFILTVQSGANQPSSVDTMKLLGNDELHNTMGEWNHYAVRLYNTGSSGDILKAELYVNGHRNDSSSWAPYSLNTELEITHVGTTTPDWYIDDIVYRYTSSGSLQGWWRFNNSTITTTAPEPDASGNNRTGSIEASSEAPSTSTSTPATYINNAGSNVWDGSTDVIKIGTAATWDALIGNPDYPGRAATGIPNKSTKMMTISAWINKDSSPTVNSARIVAFGANDVTFFQTDSEQVRFRIKTASSSYVTWATATGAFSRNQWTQLVVTYDARKPQNKPTIYVNGVARAVTLVSGTPGAYYGIFLQECTIGNGSNTGDGTLDRQFKGNIADVAIWNSVLSENEIKALYHASRYKQPFTKITELNSKNMTARIGALITSPNSSSAVPGAGRFSGSLDEFRYWKTARTPKQIGEYWFDQVRGGANSDIANADLGVYYKFNEGITNNAAIDSIVLDYAGRATNGVWTGYRSDSRNTGSAIVSASAATFEFEDPIIRPTHPSVISIKNQLIASGTSYDYNNNASLMSLMPGWIQDEAADSDNTDLYYINHIVGTYFDKINLQISQLPSLRHVNYVSSSHKPLPFSKHLPQSLGLYAPELFIDSDVLELFADRNSDTIFQNKLNETKNLIYQNLYNNLAHIFKSKGTERALRHVLRCFNIDNGLYSVNINSNNEEYILRNNFKHSLLEKNFIDFNNIENSTGVVYGAVPNTYSSLAAAIFANRLGSVDSTTTAAKSERPQYGMTLEANILFPAYSKIRPSYERDSSFNTCSLFGIEQAKSTLENRAGWDGDLAYTPDRQSSFRVYAIRESKGSKNVFFRLKAPRTDVDIQLDSPVFFNVYDNEPWNLSVRIEPNAPLRRSIISGTIPPNRMYNIIFSGFNAKTANEIDSFTVSQSVNETRGAQFITGSSRVVVGAERTDIAGALIHRSDVQFGGISYWARTLSDETLKVHARDFENVGISGSLDTISPFASGAVEQLNYQTRLMTWNFENVTGSDATGNFLVQDFASGSSQNSARGDYDSTYWLPQLANAFYTGQAKHFPASSTAVSNRKEINTYKFINPEQVVASDLVQTFSDEDILFPNLKKEEIVPNYVFSIEKSIYNAVTEQMLDFFAGAVDFHNLIGNPVNSYRYKYKEIEKLRNVFFRRVGRVSKVEKFLKYYKWFDESITTILSQLVPASSEFVDNLLNVVESHALERNKYQNRLNIIDSNTFWFETDLTITPVSYEAPIRSAGAFALVSPPASPRPTNKGVQYWNTRAERTISEISSGDANIDAQRERYRKVIWSRPHPSSSMPRLFTAGGVQYTPSTFNRNNSGMQPQLSAEIDNISKQDFIWSTPKEINNTVKGGINFNSSKDLEYAYSAVFPGGPINMDSGLFVPQNVLLAFIKDATPLTNFQTVSWPSDLIRKRRKSFNVQHGRDWEDGIGYKTTKSEKSFPFNIFSSSVEVRSGYNKEVIDQVGRNLEITNLHVDGYGKTAEVPMQGTFTENVVGGHQSRHVSLNDGGDTTDKRPEAWRLLLGTCNVVPDGAIGLVGADYPPPDFNPPAGTNQDLIYPYPKHAKAYLYRDFTAKRPVNVKNIKMTNAANTNTIAGNYRFNHEILRSFGAFNNPHHFIKQQPALPIQISKSTNTTNIRTILDIHRGEQNHFENVSDYATSYLQGTSSNSIIISRFSAPGGIEVETKGYQDFKSSEYSPYNAITYRNLTVKKPSQGPSGSISEPHGGSPSTSRVYDIHGKDYGLNSHRARHAARFGRDSLFVTSSNNLPGASYEQLPAMFKTNRNTKKLLRAYTTSETFNQNNITNLYGLLMSGSSTTAQKGKLYHAAAFKDSSGNTWTGKKFTLSAWVYLGKGLGNQESILTLGDNGLSVNRDQALGWHIDSQERPELWIQTSRGNKAKWRQTAALATGSWYHLAVVYDGNSAANEPTFYMNGVSQSMTLYNGSMTSSMESINVTGQGQSFIGGNNRNNITMIPFLFAALDEIAIYDDTFSASEITTLYSGGGTLNLSASFAPKSGSLATWLRLGDSVGDPTTNAVMTQSAGFGPTFYDVMGNNDYRVKAGSVSNIQLFMISSSYAIAPKPPSYVAGTRETQVIYSSSMYDNYNITHAIPRSDRQYMWISNSITDPSNIKYAGYQRIKLGFASDVDSDPENRLPWRSSSAGYEPFWEFVSSSDANTGSFNQPTNRLNIVIRDPIDYSNNTRGTTHINDYINRDLVGDFTLPANPDYLNQLLASRGANYGWGWNRTRQSDNRFINHQKNTNILKMITNISTMESASYRLPPVSMKGRTALVNYDERNRIASVPDTNVTLKISNTNNSIYFPERELNEYANIDRMAEYDPLNTVLSAVKNDDRPNNPYNLNWVLYCQSIFPSTRNEFASASSKRLNFDNEYWRTSLDDRITLGNTLPN